MIDKKKITAPLDVARIIAKKYVSNPKRPIFNEKNEISGYEDITSIHVCMKDHGVYLNTEIEALQDYAMRTDQAIVTVMEEGKFKKGFTDISTFGSEEEISEGESTGKKSKK